MSEMKRINVKTVLESFFNLVGQNCDKEVEGDYRNDDGLLMCHVCNKPKEKRTDVPMLGIKIHPIMCDCQKKAYDLEMLEEKRRKENSFVRELFSYSLVDERFASSTFSTFIENEQNKKQLTIAKNYVLKFDEMLARNKGLLLYGEPGTGKTFLSSCIANALMERRVSVIVTSMIKLTGVSSPFSREAEEQQKFLSKMNVADLLVIDDLGSERGTDYKLEQAFEVIDSRYGAKKPMIISTNLSLKQMQEETDIRRRRIYERIFEVCFPVRFTGTSWRYAAASNDFDEMQSLLLGK